MSLGDRLKFPYFWVLFPGVFLCLSILVSYFGLFGSWIVSVFGVPYYYNWDPDGFYLGAGLTFFDERYVWVGHPGIPLMFLIHSISKVFYWLGLLFGASVPIETFTAKNIFWIILVTKSAITIVHILSFCILYRISLIFLTKTASKIAILSYATSVIILYYMNKISPEPLLVLFVLLSIFWIWKYVENHHKYKGYIWLALSAFAGIAAVMTKIMIATPLVAFLPAYILLHQGISLKNKMSGTCLFLCFGAMFFILLGWKVDWYYFFQFWSQYAPSNPDSTGGVYPLFSFIQAISHIITNFLFIMADGLFSFFSISGLTSQKGQFNAAELPFMALSVVGFIQYWKDNPPKRRQMTWLLIFALITAPCVLYKGAYHYLVIHLAFAAIFFSYFICESISKILKGTALSKNKFATAVIATLMIHSLSIAIFVETKWSDIRNYMNNWQPYYIGLNTINHEERIGISNTRDKSEIPGRLISYYVPPSSSFNKRFRDYFVYLDGDTSQDKLKEKNITVVISSGAEWTNIIRNSN